MSTLKSYALTTGARSAAYMGLTYSSLSTAQQDFLTDLINQATEFVEHYIGRRLLSSTYTQEIYDGDGGNVLALKHYPVTTFSTIEFRTSSQNEDNWETINSKAYYVDNDSGLVKGMSGRRFARGRANYRCTYTAGFSFNNSTTFLADTAAGEIELIVWRLVSNGYNTHVGTTDAVTSERIGDYSVTYAKTVSEDEGLTGILDGYKSSTAIGSIVPFSIY